MCVYIGRMCGKVRHLCSTYTVNAQDYVESESLVNGSCGARIDLVKTRIARSEECSVAIIFSVIGYDLYPTWSNS